VASVNPESKSNHVLSYSPQLDGLRAIAVGMVVVVHFVGGNGLGRGGWIGVDVFFVLSGFLITTLLINEADRTPAKRFSLVKFYVRRIFRLWPAYFAFVLGAMLYAAVWQPHNFAIWFHQLLLSALFYLNVYATSHETVMGIGQLWSLCVEEQFYIIWALILLACCTWATRRTTAIVAASGAIASTVISVVLVADGASWWRLYHALDTNAVSLLLGALAGLAFAGGHLDGLARPRLANWVVALFLFVTAGWFLGITNVNTWIYAGPIQFFCALTALAIVLLVLVPAAPIGRILSGSAIVWVGKLSYSIYLWNELVIAAVPKTHGSVISRAAHLLAEIILIAVLSLASYYGVERWGLRVKNRFFEPRRMT